MAVDLELEQEVGKIDFVELRFCWLIQHHLRRLLGQLAVCVRVEPSSYQVASLHFRTEADWQRFDELVDTSIGGDLDDIHTDPYPICFDVAAKDLPQLYADVCRS